jgi:hypothetical protein
MSAKIKLQCACGAVKGTLDVVPKEFFHVHCLCNDCQKFAAYLENQDKILDQHGGSELFQTYPSNLCFTEGNDNIRCVQLREKGLYRWHTSCCNMPLGNTMTSAKVPFVGVSVKLMRFENPEQKQQLLGPVTLKAFGKYALGDMPSDVHPDFPKSFMPKILKFMIKGLFKGKSKPSPFFRDGEPVAKPDRAR